VAEFPDNFCVARVFLPRKALFSNPIDLLMKHHRSIRHRVAAGFTLLEMVIVLGIIAVLLGGSIALIGGVGEGAKLQRVKGDFQSIGSALRTYKINAGNYPTTQQGLKALVEKPTTTPKPDDWVKIADKVPTDPWKNEYGYKFPGSKNPAEFEIISKGPDGIEGNEDDRSSQSTGE
jgi:general secretion pathway protein G